jgi:hypothetical protein
LPFAAIATNTGSLNWEGDVLWGGPAQLTPLPRPQKRLVTNTRYNESPLSTLDTVVLFNVLADNKQGGGEQEEANIELNATSRPPTPFLVRGRVPAP